MINGFTNNEGFSLVETLAAIVIIGITTTAVLFFINKFMGRSNYNSRMEAILLVQKEIQNTIANHSMTDTSYTNSNGNLTIYRKVIDNHSYYKLDFTVVLHNNKKLVIIPLVIKK